uniref:Multiple epidermal growth factor-like domains 11 n=1 Tax=Magallana gigas TaxID=29159 RepID=K1QV61_MAGGI
MPSSPKSASTSSSTFESTCSTLDFSLKATAPSTEEVAEQAVESACTSEPNIASEGDKTTSHVEISFEQLQKMKYETFDENMMHVHIYRPNAVYITLIGGSLNTIRLREYFILFSNVSTLSEARVCYSQPPGVIDTTILEEDCQSTARYIWFYQNKTFEGPVPMLEICEVQVFGCETGFYGENCSSTCDHCKNTETCGIVNGHCDEQGCALSGFQAPKCTECSPGFFGADCDKVCSQTCKLDNSCKRTTGFCLHGCDIGYIGDYCNSTCSSGTYGQDCKETCGLCLNNMTCNPFNGTCPSGCNAGFEGHICKTQLAERTSEKGKTCASRETITNLCTRPALSDSLLSGGHKSCSSGTYGQNCNEPCGNCLNNTTCNRYNGTCPSGCNAGFEGHICKTPCSSGTYGQNCNEPCGNCLNNTTCNRYNGTCPSGCNAGFEGHICKTPCSSGTYGQDCNEPCGNCLNNTTCNRYNGTCPSGCNAGFEGHICKTPCNNGTFGKNCVHQCGHCLNGDPCNKTDGTCQNCTAGGGGELCNIALKQEQSVELIVGSSAGLLVFVASVAVAVFLIRKSRKRKDTSKTEDKTNTSDLTNVGEGRGELMQTTYVKWRIFV